MASADDGDNHGGVPSRHQHNERVVSAIVVGCGQRGRAYSDFALDFPSRLRIAAVADPIARRRDRFARRFGIADDRLIAADWKELANMEQLADVAIITTQDRMHLGPAVAFAAKGYALLLEKPMAVDEGECEAIARACRENDGVIAAVCHVLRYFPPCIKIREIIEAGSLGDVVHIDHCENVGFWHFAHSFVRGNWRNSETSTFSLLAKCCHDIDLVMYWMGDRKCSSIQSFGGLHHFRADRKPKDASARCFDCPVEEGCPYSAQKVYLQPNKGYPHWPMSVVCDIEDHPGGYAKALEGALRESDYGKCVYDCDNDVCDHQTVNMHFECGATASLTMNAFTKDMRRETRISGSRGELRWDGGANTAIKVYDFATGTESEIYPDAVVPKESRMKGHGGADYFLVDAFVKAVAAGDSSLVRSDIGDSLRSHKLVFAAERSRLNGTIESIDI